MLESFKYSRPLYCDNGEKKLPINICKNVKIKDIVKEKSNKADLTIVGMTRLTQKNKSNIFGGYENMGNMLFVNSMKQKDLD